MIHTTLRATCAFAALAALAACAPKATAPAAVDTSKEVAALKADTDQFNADYKAHDAVKLTAGDTPDLIQYFPFTPVQKGVEDPKAMAAQFAADPAMGVVVTPDRIEVAKSGDLAYVVGHAEQTRTNAKTHAVEHSTSGYVAAYRKGADGKWTMVALSVSPGPPAPGAAKP